MGRLFCKMSDLHQVNPFSFSQQMKDGYAISEHYFITTSSLTIKSVSVKTRKGVGSQILFIDYWHRAVWCNEHSISNTNEDSSSGLISPIYPAV